MNQKKEKDETKNSPPRKTPQWAVFLFQEVQPESIVLSGCVGYLIFAYFTDENEP